MSESDAELISRAKRGDEHAFRALLVLHGDSLYRTACMLLGQREGAEDVVQETFLAASVGLHRFEGRASLRTWLGGILVRQAALWHRRQKTQRAPAPLTDADLPAARDAPGGVDARMDVLAMLGRLPAEQREILTLREFEGMSYEQIATVLGIPAGTVDSRLHRARQALKVCLAEYQEGTRS